MKKISVLFLGILLLLSSSLGRGESLESIAADVEAWALENQGKDIPAPVAVALNNQRLQGHLTVEGGQELLVGIVIENKKFSSITLNEIKDPTIEVYMGLNTLTDIMNSQNSAGIFQKAVKEGKITYKAHGLFNKIKLFLLLKFALKMAELKPSLPELNESSEDTEKTRKKGAASDQETEKSLPDTKTKKGGFLPEEGKESSNSVSKADNSTAKASPTVTETEATTSSVENISTSQSHTVLLIDGGFEVKEVRINAGDTVIWKNERESRYSKGMVLGTKACARLKSGFFGPGEIFRGKFEKSGECVVVDGIYTTQTMKVIVE